uniref:Uncharacterized protein n=1 Tax=Lepeophtheirus salmonis TaxID=72036 RepID=A0A0K2TE67_LEPSM
MVPQGLEEIGLTVFFNSSRSSVAFLTEPLFFSNVFDLLSRWQWSWRCQLLVAHEWKFVYHVQESFSQLVRKLE